VKWDARTPGPWAAELDGAAAIVNLSEERRLPQDGGEIGACLESRRRFRAGARGRRARGVPPATVWVQTATAHIYGRYGGPRFWMSLRDGQGFAADPVGGARGRRRWPKSRFRRGRKVVLRISFVLGRNGGGAGNAGQIGAMVVSADRRVGRSG